ncbi:PREDICTED: uncharacterized protein LOC106313456 [Brassica oleracea var. oleracea]|uniref:uncharacterized protein LOC106313456 n=1 Tax=Brassica oleracea var. oleracea TaxID=109376 RepID=UPI0006A6C598|nr:PREDICTED: uncharacterized protein LOC106313456 [Brassica oleracea var. oleracea]
MAVDCDYHHDEITNQHRSGDINLQRYGIAEDYYWNENMENWKRYNKMRRIQKASPERRRENRKGNGGWTDGAKHEERARSYKGVVINSNTGQQNRERDSREYYGKGKGKMVEASDSKWVKVPERGTRRPPNQYGNYRGNGEGSRVKIHVRRRYSCGLWSSSGVYQVICSATKRGSGSASCTSGNP